MDNMLLTLKQATAILEEGWQRLSKNHPDAGFYVMVGAVGNDPTSAASKAASPASERPGKMWCPRCNGSGLSYDRRHDWGAGQACSTCLGRGYITAEKT